MALLPIDTRRLHIRVMRPADAPVLSAYRSDVEIGRFQDWSMPYGLDEALRMLEGQADVVDLPADGWVQLAVDHAGQMIGDLAVGVVDGHIAHVGYTLAPAFHGKGYAGEALSTLVDVLFRSGGIHRIVASVDPDNTASMRVLEGQGFTYEGRARSAEFVRGAWVDDDRYGLLRSDREAWLGRPSSASSVELVELDVDNVRAFAQLATHHSQERFVAPMSASFRDALFPEIIDGSPVVPWMRGIVADGSPVGFVMLADVTAAHPDPYLWRLLVDRMHQRRGVGSAALSLVIELLRARRCRRLLTSWVEGPGGPRAFYERMGFEATGAIVDGEVEGALTLSRT